MQRIYLDANATTPVLLEVVEAMRPFWSDSFGNPSSAHQSGQRTRSAVERARASVAFLLNCTPKEIVFTSGGTEGDNLALTGILQPYLDRREPAHLITTSIEHHAVLYAAEALERRGIEVTCLAPTGDGVIDPAAFEAALKPHTKLVSVMLANNETGAIQPIGKIARIAKEHGILVHTDAVQAAGKCPLDLSGEFKNVDLLTISGHKMYASQGTGALFVRKGVTLAPLFYGGPHERQRRAGTENVPGIVALGKAADLAREWLSQTSLAHNPAIVISSKAPSSSPVISTEAAKPRSGETRSSPHEPSDAQAQAAALSTEAHAFSSVISTEAAKPRSGETRSSPHAPSDAQAQAAAISAEAHAFSSVISTEAAKPRSGETPVFAEASAQREQVNHNNSSSLQALRDHLEASLLAAIPNTHINAAAAPRVPNTTNIRFKGIDAESLLIALDMQGIAASFGAACMSGATEPSHVLLAMGLTPAEARSSLRLSLSRLTTAEEIDRALAIIPAAVTRLRSLS